MKYPELMKAINQNHFEPVYLFTGSERHIALMMEKNLIRSAVPEALTQLNVMTFSDQDLNIADVTAICRQMPMMSERRIVILREETGILHSSDPTVIDALCEYVENPEPSTCLIVYDSHPDKRKKLWKVFSKSAAVVDFSKLTQPELEKWIARRLKIAGKKTKRSVVEQFIENTMYLTKESQTMEIIDNELDKIFNYLGDREEITLSDLDAVMPKSIDDDVFRMMDCIMSNKTDTAMTMLNNFYTEGESPFGIFGLLVSQIRTLLQIKLLSDHRISQAEIAKTVGRPAFVIRKMQVTLQCFTKAQLIALIKKAGQLDFDMKTGVVEPELGLTLYILGMNQKI